MTRTRRLSDGEKKMIRDMKAGWTPFPFQVPETGKKLENKGLIRAWYDDDNRIVYTLTPEGKAYVEPGK